MVLAEFVFQCWKIVNILKAIDPKLEGNYIAEEAELVLRLGLLCSHRGPKARPNMRHLVQYLSGDAAMMDFTLESAAIAILGM